MREVMRDWHSKEGASHRKLEGKVSRWLKGALRQGELRSAALNSAAVASDLSSTPPAFFLLHLSPLDPFSYSNTNRPREQVSYSAAGNGTPKGGRLVRAGFPSRLPSGAHYKPPAERQPHFPRIDPRQGPPPFAVLPLQWPAVDLYPSER